MQTPTQLPVAYEHGNEHVEVFIFDYVSVVAEQNAQSLF